VLRCVFEPAGEGVAADDGGEDGTLLHGGEASDGPVPAWCGPCLCIPPTSDTHGGQTSQ
jgi:hypothetical protein